MDVQVHRDPDGEAVLVGTPPAGPAGLGAVALTGSQLYVDPCAPDDPPYAVVEDAAESSSALEAVYGQALAATVAGAGDGTVTVGLGPAHATVRTIGLVRWLDSHTPDLLPTALLDVQFGVAVADLGELADEFLQDEGEDRLRRHSGLVLALSRGLREPGSRLPGLTDLISGAVARLAHVLPADHPHQRELEHEDELAEALHVLGGAHLTPDWTALLELPELGGRELLGAAHAGGPDAAPGVDRAASVDWHQVPRGLLDSAEGTVRWSVAGGDPRTVRVAVRAAAGAPDSTRLAFRVYAPDFPIPVAVGTLRRSADRSEFTGDAVLVMPTAGPLTVDVHDALDTRPPRLGPDAVLARGTRWAARGVTALRLGGSAPAALDAARGALEEAGGLFSEAAQTLTRTGPRELARRREARCDALVRAVLLRGGHHRMASAMAGPWDPLPGSVTTADVTPPDLGLAGWLPLVAERALGSDPRRWPG